jgi:hypothetical protein
MPIDMSDVGPGRKYGSVIEKMNAENGTYSNPVDKMPEDEKLPLKQFPLGPAPSPFKISPL